MRNNKLSKTAVAVMTFFALGGFVHAGGEFMTKERNLKVTPEKALNMLVDGNKRFVDAKPQARDLRADVKAASKGQFPYAAVISCLDSRIPTEGVFDQGIGDLFVGRVAGNFVNDDILGSLEFAATGKSGDDWVGVKLIVIMGHTDCGAVKGAVAEAQLGLLTTTLANINPAIKAVQASNTSKKGDKNFVHDVTVKNVHLTMDKLRDRSLVLRGLIDQGKVKLVGAVYDMNTGKVNFLDHAK